MPLPLSRFKWFVPTRERHVDVQPKFTPEKWRYRLDGHLIDEDEATGPVKKELFVFGAPHKQKQLVTKNVE
jgi:hypothetical protein